jgi:MSHA biogenesis protein MshP
MRTGSAKPQHRQQFAQGFGGGFALVPALFLIVVIALLAAVAVRVTTAQQQTVSLALQQARALSAARAGIDWAAYSAINGINGGCAGLPTLNLPAASFAGYTVVVTCIPTAYTDGSVSYSAYTIASTATFGTYGTPDFVQRVVRATFTNEP